MNGIDISIKNKFGNLAVNEALINEIIEDINNFSKYYQGINDFIVELRKKDLIKFAYYVYAP